MLLFLVMVRLHTATRFDAARAIVGKVKALMGRPPITMWQYVEDYADAWQRDEPRSGVGRLVSSRGSQGDCPRLW
jgi:hypothetical protein